MSALWSNAGLTTLNALFREARDKWPDRTYLDFSGGDARLRGALDPREFPIQNRPIFYRPVGSMSYNDGVKTDHIDITLPKPLGAVTRPVVKTG